MAKNIFVRDRDDTGTQSDTTSIAFVHHKGGTGKTTSCLNIAGWLTRMKNKVLVIDLDPQGNATSGLGIDRKTIASSIYDVLFGQKNIEEIIIETDSGVYLAPSSLDLLSAETHMAGQANNTRILKGKIDSIKTYFDCILIDVPPGSTLLMINGMAASENIIIPLDAGIFAYETLETLKALVISLNEELGVEINVAMVLLKEYSTSFLDKFLTLEARNLLKGFLKTNLSSDVTIFTIPFSRKIHQAQIKGMPISHYAPFSDVGRAYKRIAKEIVNS
jgi:chromosome partitioning protein